MQLGKPIWEPTLAGLFVRVPIGLYFVLVARAKLSDMSGVMASVQSWNLMPEQLANLFAVLLPFVELTMGLLLIVGLWSSLAALVTSVLLVIYILVFGLFPNPKFPEIYSINVILLGGTLSLLASGAGAMSVDNFRKG